MWLVEPFLMILQDCARADGWVEPKLTPNLGARFLLRTYRSPKSLVTNLVMNLVTNLVITKLGEEFGDIFVTLFGDSPNWVMILMSFSSPHLVGHEIG